MSEARKRWRRATTGPLVLLRGTLVGLALAVLAIPACAPETRYRILSTVFDGVPPPGSPPKERRPRRVARVEPVPAPVITEDEGLPLAPAAPPEPKRPPQEYSQVLATFPKDSMGNVDWVAAVEAELIEPSPGVDPEAPASPVLPYDVILDPGIPQFEVVFPHAAHTYWLRCDNCHPAIFEMKAGANPITMAKIFEGEYCGRCHGKVAFPPQTGCPRCHVRLGRSSAVTLPIHRSWYRFASVPEDR